jgi:hypothetical protein
MAIQVHAEICETSAPGGMPLMLLRREEFLRPQYFIRLAALCFITGKLGLSVAFFTSLKSFRKEREPPHHRKRINRLRALFPERFWKGVILTQNNFD